MSQHPTLLICDQDVYALHSLKEQLDGIGLNVITTTTKKETLDFLNRFKIDVILINLDLDDSDAIVICQEIRNKKEIIQPFIIIYSDKNEDYVQITSFNSGADDFLIKPLKPLLVGARIKALLRRGNQQIIKETLPQKGVFIDKERYRVIKDNQTLSLPKKEFEILDLLFSNPNKVFTRQEIATEIWNNMEVAKQRTIDIHIRNIRKIIGSEIIKTIKGIGYSIN